jgi:type I site-specific restriction-modification system R (restriction) subunit
LKHPEDEVSLFVGKKRSIQMCLPAAFASSKKVRHVPVTPQESSSEHDKFSPQAHDEKAFHTPSQSKLDSAPRIPILSACKAPSFSSSSDGTIDLLDDKKISASTLPSKQEAIILDDSDDEVEIVKKSVKKVNYVSEDVFEVPERIRKNEEALKKEKEDKLARIEARAKEAKKANEEKKKEAKKANEEKKKAKEAEKLRKEQEKREKKAALKAAKEAKEAKEAKKAAGKDQEKKDKKGKEGKKKDLEKAVVVSEKLCVFYFMINISHFITLFR